MNSVPARRSIYMLFAANAISMTGNQLAALAVPWFVLATTGSAAKAGVTAFSAILPVVIAAFFGGALVDRVGFKRMSVISDFASGITIALIPLFYSAGLLDFWLLQVLVFFGALLDAPGTTAREAIVPELAEAAQMPLERASALIQVVERGARLVGAPVGGLLIALMGAQNVMWVNAATFALSMLLVGLAVPTVAAAPTVDREHNGSEILAGLRYLRADGLLLLITMTIMVTNMLDAGLSSVILPFYALETYDSAVVLGLMSGLAGGGSVAGALLYSAIGHRFSRYRVYIFAFIAVSLRAFVLATLPPLGIVLLTQALMGFAAGPINPILSTIQFERIPAAMRGRVFGTITAGACMAMPLGVLSAGYLLEGVSIQTALLIVGALSLLTTVAQALFPALKEMDRRVNHTQERAIQSATQP